MMVDTMFPPLITVYSTLFSIDFKIIFDETVAPEIVSTSRVCCKITSLMMPLLYLLIPFHVVTILLQPLDDLSHKL